MKSPSIQVYHWHYQNPYHPEDTCDDYIVKIPNTDHYFSGLGDEYISEIKSRNNFKEKLVFEGEINPMLRILPIVNPNFLKIYGGWQGEEPFRSQIVPTKVFKNDILDKVSIALRGRCWNMYDQEIYDNEGKIRWSFQYYKYLRNPSDKEKEILDYLFSLCSKDDMQRIKSYQKQEEKEFNEK